MSDPGRIRPYQGSLFLFVAFHRIKNKAVVRKGAFLQKFYSLIVVVSGGDPVGRGGQLFGCSIGRRIVSRIGIFLGKFPARVQQGGGRWKASREEVERSA